MQSTEVTRVRSSESFNYTMEVTTYYPRVGRYTPLGSQYFGRTLEVADESN